MTEGDSHHRPLATVHVIITCSNQKSRPIPARLQLGQVPGRSAAERARKWITRLSQTGDAPQVAALELYAGEHWSVARRYPALHKPEEDIRLWACSVGYGLIPAEAPIMPYHATLTPGQADSVPGAAASWWSLLSEWHGPAPQHPRSIRALVAADPAAVFMFVLSKSYLRACGADIAAACEYIADLDRLLIVSAGARLQGDLAAFAVPADARLQAHFGGTRRALNARIGAHLLSTGIRSKEEATGHLARLLAAQPPIRRYDRKKQSDREISRHHRGPPGPGAGHTSQSHAARVPGCRTCLRAAPFHPAVPQRRGIHVVTAVTHRPRSEAARTAGDRAGRSSKAPEGT